MSRIYESQQAGVNFEGQSRGGSFNPQKAADNTKQLKQKAAAKEQDFRVRAREAARREEMDRLELDGQQRAEASALALSQSMEMNGLMLEQGWASNNLKIQQDYETAVMSLEASELQAKGQVDAAKTQLISSAVQGILSFTNEAIQLPNAIEEAKLRKLKLEEAERKRAAEVADIKIARADFGLTGDAPKVDLNTSQVEADNQALGAATKSIANSVGQLESEGTNEALSAAGQLITNGITIPWAKTTATIGEMKTGLQPAITNLIANLPVEAIPSTGQERRKLIRLLARQYLTDHGFLALSEANQNDILLSQRSQLGQFDTALAKRYFENAKSTQVAETDTFIAQEINSFGDGQDLRNVVDHGLRGYGVGGITPESTTKFVETFLGIAELGGDVEIIDEFAATKKIPGQAGTEFGFSHSKLISDSRAAAQARREYLTKQAITRGEAAMKDNLRSASTTDQRVAVINEYKELLLELPNGGGLAKIQELDDNIKDLLNPAVQPKVLYDYETAILRGEITQVSTVRALPDIDAYGVETLEAKLKEVGKGIDDDPYLDNLAKNQTEFALLDLKGKLGVSKDPLTGQPLLTEGVLKGSSDAMLAGRILRSLETDLDIVRKRAYNTLRDNNLPKGELHAKVLQAGTDFLQIALGPGGKYSIELPPNNERSPQQFDSVADMLEAKFKNETSARLLDVVPTVDEPYFPKVFKYSSIEEALNKKGSFDSSRGDTLFKSSYQKELSANYEETGQFSPGFIELAKSQGMSPLALLNSQNVLHKEKEVLFTTPLASSRSAPAGVAVKVLMGKELSAEGAQFLSGQNDLDMVEMLSFVDRMGGVPLSDGSGRSVLDVFKNPLSTSRQLTDALMQMTGGAQAAPVKKSPSSPGNQSSGIGEPIYYSGNIGPTSTGPHLDVKKVGRGKFDETALDDFVVVQDPEFGMVSLGDIRNKTGGIGDNWDQHVARGSYGIDYGLHDGTEIYLKNGAKVIGSTPTEHGDMLTIELPNGDQYTFLHGSSAKQ